MKESKEEYLMLREEILHLDTVVNNTISFFYGFLATLLAFALTKKDTIYILLSYIIIIPAYQIVVSKTLGMVKIGAYLRHYHEGVTFNWETRNSKYMQKNSQKISSSNYPFMFANIVVMGLFLLFTKWSMTMSWYECIKIIIAIVMFLWMTVRLKKNKCHSTDACIEEWKKID